jgi:hypothetical protein
VNPWQVAVENEHVVVSRGQLFFGDITREGDVDRHVLSAQSRGQDLGELGVVFGDKDAHCGEQNPRRRITKA